jgi:hypothetical protein
VTPLGDCIEWKGARINGYGVKKVGGKQRRVHRLTWEEVHGPIPDGMFVLHHCDNPACYNVTHLFLGDHRENMRDMAEKGRAANAKKDSCPQGHSYDAVNADGTRRCKTCSAEASRAYYRRRVGG